MKRILATLIVMCALSVSTFAGEIPTCSPAPTAVMVTGDVPINGSSVTGNMPTNGFSNVTSETESSVLTEVWLTLVNLLVR